MEKRIILGIDPGTNILGHATIIVSGREISMGDMDVLKLQHLDDAFEKLSVIYRYIDELIRRHEVTEMAIEAPFYGKNVQSMLKLGRAQGVSIAAALANGLSVCEYSPRKIKQSITGKGNSTKEQVALMLERLVPFTSVPKYLDATDALGVAVCHYFQNTRPETRPAGRAKTKTVSSWKSFLSQNPDRIK